MGEVQRAAMTKAELLGNQNALVILIVRATVGTARRRWNGAGWIRGGTVLQTGSELGEASLPGASTNIDAAQASWGKTSSRAYLPTGSPGLWWLMAVRSAIAA